MPSNTHFVSKCPYFYIVYQHIVVDVFILIIFSFTFILVHLLLCLHHSIWVFLFDFDIYQCWFPRWYSLQDLSPVNWSWGTHGCCWVIAASLLPGAQSCMVLAPSPGGWDGSGPTLEQSRSSSWGLSRSLLSPQTAALLSVYTGLATPMSLWESPWMVPEWVPRQTCTLGPWWDWADSGHRTAFRFCQELNQQACHGRLGQLSPVEFLGD